MAVMVTRSLASAYLYWLTKIGLYKLESGYIIISKLLKSQNCLKTEDKNVSQSLMPPMGVGNEFIIPHAKVPVVAVAAVVSTPAPVPVAPIVAVPTLEDVELDFENVAKRRRSPWKQLASLFHRYTVGAFALLFLLVGGSGILVYGAYESAQITLATNSSQALRIPATPLRGPNTTVALAEVPQAMQRIAGQPLTITIGDQATVTVGPETIQTWLQIAQNKKQGVAYIHVNETAIAKSINDAAAPYIRSAANQVAVTYADGTSAVIVAGHNGTKLGDTTAAKQQIAQNLLSARGIQTNLPMDTIAFAALTPANFDKMIEVNVASKQMWLYEKGNLVKQYPISAGAPATPTPIGQYKIYSKLANQDMTGFNADGSKYFQPHVHWINYFLPGGYAVHGNYWRPLDWFGAVNSSHGCVSLPDDQAKEVYDWAPIGTPVITHY